MFHPKTGPKAKNLAEGPKLGRRPLNWAEGPVWGSLAPTQTEIMLSKGQYESSYMYFACA